MAAHTSLEWAASLSQKTKPSSFYNLLCRIVQVHKFSFIQAGKLFCYDGDFLHVLNEGGGGVGGGDVHHKALARIPPSASQAY